LKGILKGIETIETIDSDRRRSSRNRVSRLRLAASLLVRARFTKKKSGRPRLPAVEIALVIARHAQPRR